MEPCGWQKEGSPASINEEQDDDDSYFVGGEGKSLALIFNHMSFDCGLQPRPSAKVDGERLRGVLEALNFDVRLHEDLTMDELFKKLDKARDGKEDRDCLLVAVMTHGGGKGWLYAKDHSYYEQQLWERFEEAPSLIGKPKIFLLQCCRGKELDKGVHPNVLSCKVLPEEGPLLRPKNADFYIVHSTPTGYGSWKSQDGAWLIQDFCSQLEKHAAKKDLAKIMASVANSMSKRLSNVEKDEKSDSSRYAVMIKSDMKQVPVATSTLTKFFYFCKQTK